jgi:hypothetical protein
MVFRQRRIHLCTYSLTLQQISELVRTCQLNYYEWAYKKDISCISLARLNLSNLRPRQTSLAGTAMEPTLEMNAQRAIVLNSTGLFTARHNNDSELAPLLADHSLTCEVSFQSFILFIVYACLYLCTWWLNKVDKKWHREFQNESRDSASVRLE